MFCLLLGFGALAAGPASQVYGRVDAWQDLASSGRALERDAAGRPIILFAPDETTRAFIDMFTRTAVSLVSGPPAGAAVRLRAELAANPRSVVVAQLAGRSESPVVRELLRRLGLPRRPALQSSEDTAPAWAAGRGLRVAHVYGLPNGRRYALLELGN